MASFIDPILNAMDSFLEWFSSSLKQSGASYIQLETAENEHTLVARDGSLVSLIKVNGTRFLVGSAEFERLHEGVTQTFQSATASPGHAIQISFSFDKEGIEGLLSDILEPAHDTAERLELKLEDLFQEKINYLSKYCAKEDIFFVLWTRPNILSNQQRQHAEKRKREKIKKNKIPPMRYAQNFMAALPELREIHESFVRTTYNDFELLGLDSEVVDVHDAIRFARTSLDPEFTDKDWQPYLPGDKLPLRLIKNRDKRDISNVMWPDLTRQIIPRDAENISLRSCRIGDRLYAPLYIDLFPKDVKSFHQLFIRANAANIPWRISFLMESGALNTMAFKSSLAAILSFASSINPLINNSAKLLKYIDASTDDSVVKIRVCLATWAPAENKGLLQSRAAELAKVVQGWGGCEVSEVSGDAFEGVISSAVAVTSKSVATPTLAPLSELVYMLPLSRPVSPWKEGALLFRSPDGKPWPYQPGSTLQTTWIDLIYARPGSGKSVLSNTINLGLCLSSGLQRLPRIAIIDVGPSSSGLISLLQEALPERKKHLAAYHRMRMTPDFAINPFDTQLGSRYPTPQERSFLVNFLTLLATPLGAERPYDGITDMAGMVVDELYKEMHDKANPNRYTPELSRLVDERLTQLNFNTDAHTTWWEVTDFLFKNDFVHEAMLAQRFAMPLMADAASVCRNAAIEDLFGKVIAPTGETLIQAFSRMLSSSVREYPILSRVTAFDLGEARIVSLDLDEVAKTGGEAADRQTAVMYMIARFALARDYYLTMENVGDFPELYRHFHRQRITEIREDPKRIVYDEFHRTAKAAAVRDQVVVDMREGRKWKVEVALISQSLEDFDSVMIDFATSIFIMDAGPAQTVKKTTEIFGLSDTAKKALRTRVHGPREGGGTFLAQFATKTGMNTQLLTNTLGPIELWAFSTTTEDASVRNALYERIGPINARRVLATLYPAGTISKVVEQRLAHLKAEGLLTDESSKGVIQALIEEIITEYKTNPLFRQLA